jgi:hypothetical protein
MMSWTGDSVLLDFVLPKMTQGRTEPPMSSLLPVRVRGVVRIIRNPPHVKPKFPPRGDLAYAKLKHPHHAMCPELSLPQRTACIPYHRRYPGT